jgi:hypothetical protein
MTQTPGQLLAAELERREIRLTDFARSAGRTFQTAYNWTKDKGFGTEQREVAARALGEPPDYFATPTLVEQREFYRRTVLKEFRAHHVGKTLTEEEWRSIESFRWPQEVAPSVSRYWGLVKVIRGELTAKEFDTTVDTVEQAMQRPPQLRLTPNSPKMLPNAPKKSPKTGTKKANKRKKPRPPHR